VTLANQTTHFIVPMICVSTSATWSLTISIDFEPQ